MTKNHVMVVKIADLVIWNNKDILMCPDQKDPDKGLVIPRYLLGGKGNVHEFLREEVRRGLRMALGNITTLYESDPVPSAISKSHWVDLDIRLFTAQYRSSFAASVYPSQPTPQWVPAKDVLASLPPSDPLKHEVFQRLIQYLTAATKDH